MRAEVPEVTAVNALRGDCVVRHKKTPILHSFGVTEDKHYFAPRSYGVQAFNKTTKHARPHN